MPTYEWINKYRSISSWIVFLLQPFKLSFLNKLLSCLQDCGESEQSMVGSWHKGWRFHHFPGKKVLCWGLYFPLNEAVILFFPLPCCLKHFSLCFSLQPQHLNYKLSLPDPSIYSNHSPVSFGLGANLWKLASLCGQEGEGWDCPSYCTVRSPHITNFVCHLHSPLLFLLYLILTFPKGSYLWSSLFLCVFWA